jgi:hypothetical protein
MPPWKRKTQPASGGEPDAAKSQDEAQTATQEDGAVEPVIEAPSTGLPATAEAYAAARAAMATRMLGYELDAELEADIEQLQAELGIQAAKQPVVEVAPQAQAWLVPTEAVTPIVPPKEARPRRRRSALLVLGGLALVAVVALVGAGVLSAALSHQPGPGIDATASTPAIAAATASPTPKPTPTPTPKPTPKPTPRPTAKPKPKPAPTKRPTPKPPALFAAWVSITPGQPPVFTVRTLAGAACKVTRVRQGGTTQRTSSTFTANAAGTAVLSNWTAYAWNHATTYQVTATCTVGTSSASTPQSTVTIP